jgi:hypothetical protein
MAITYVNAGTRVSSSGATSATPALPASRVNGNLLIAVCGTKNNATHTTATAEWNKIDQRNSGTGWTLSLFWKLVDGTDSAPVITWTGSVANFAIQFQYTGGAPSNPIGAFLANNGTGSPHTNAGLVATRDESQVIYLGGATANTAYGTSTGWTENADAGSATGATRHVAGRRNATINTGASSGSISISGATGAWVLYQVELLEPLIFTGNGSLTQGSQEISGSGTRTVPVYSGSGSLTQGSQTISGSGSFVGVNVAGSGALVQGSQTISGSGTRTVPVFQGSGAIIQGSQNIAGSGSFTVPVYSGSGAIIQGSQTISGSGIRTVPIFQGSGSLTQSSQNLSGQGVRTVPVFQGNGSLTQGSQTISGIGTFGTASFAGDGALIQSSQTLSGTGSFVGQDITGNGALIGNAGLLSGSGEFIPVPIFGSGGLIQSIEIIEGLGQYFDPIQLTVISGNSSMKVNYVLSSPITKEVEGTSNFEQIESTSKISYISEGNSPIKTNIP